jgi:hypothetical protein
MKIPTAQELGGMLKRLERKAEIKFAINAGRYKQATIKEANIYVREELLKLLKAIGLPEPDFDAEPLLIEEWEKKQVDGYVTLDFEQQTISANESAIYIGGLPLSEWKKKLGIEEPNTDEQE